MSYNLTPFNPDNRYQGQVKSELGLANTNFTILGQAFLNNDPTSQPIIRATYIGSIAPANPVAGTNWLDTSSSTPILKVYDGSNWQIINGSTSSSNSSSCCDTLNSAFYNKDPSSQPILRAVYINSSVPSSPVADMLWYDTSSNILKLYDGNNWKSINDLSSINSQINNLNNSVNTLNTQTSNLNSAFLNNDPTKPILRATYIGTTAPSNPVAGTTWLDTSQSTPTLKVYDGSNWQVASNGSSSSSNNTSSNRVDLSNATSDYNLSVGQEAVINFSNVSNVPLHIATQSGSYYEVHLICSNTGGTSGASNNPIYLYPNNTTYSGAFQYAEYIRNGSGSGSSYVSYSAFRCGWAYSNATFYITNYTQYKNLRGFCDIYGSSSHDFPSLDIFSTDWGDTSTAWTSLGTIVFPQQTSGYILVRRLA